MSNLHVKFIQIPREENKHADCLAKAASAEHMIIPNQVLSFIQNSPLIESISVQEIGSENDWMTPITSYLKDGVLPDGREAARRFTVQATQFVLNKDVLYKRGFSRPYLRCLTLQEANYVMREVHKGVYRNHSRSQSLGHKLIWV